MSLNILHINANDMIYGADRAAYRIHKSLIRHGSAFGIHSSMRVIRKIGDDVTIDGCFPRGQSPLWRHLRPRLGQFVSLGFKTGNNTLHSIAWPDTGLGRELGQRRRLGEVDILHLHWLGANTLSIEEIGHLPKPLIWTQHDQWSFCGAEHYSSPRRLGETASSDERYCLGYVPESRPSHESGVDLNRRTWLRKQRAWRQPIHIVCPSSWMADCVKRSTLMARWPVRVIPHPIDLDVWAPLDKSQAKSIINLPRDRPIVLFGAMGGTADQRKGADLLMRALQILRNRVAGTSLSNIQLVVFGQSRPTELPELNFPIHYLGHLHDDISLRLLYAAADVMVVPSRQEAFGQTASEAHSCGTPVVAFRSGGLTDIVDDHRTGVLAEPFDPSSLADAIQWVLADPGRHRDLCVSARHRAQRLWDSQRIARLYAEIYEELLKTCFNPSFS